MSHSNNIQRTLEALFKKKPTKQGTMIINQGMQFDRPFAKWVWLLFMFVLIGAILALVKGMVILGVILLPLLFPIAAYIIDIQGFEVDFKQGKIRHYKWFLGLHSGKWLPLSAFDSIRVYQHGMKTRRGLVGSVTGKKYDSNTYYYVRLVSPGLKTSITILELDNYNRAKYHAETFARHARLIFIDRPARLKTVVIGGSGQESESS